MEKRISEKELKIPALLIIKNNPGESTAFLISKLTALFCPTGKDAQLISNRKDTHFSQKVRNLKSHNALIEYTFYSKKEGWTINECGISYLSSNMDLIKDVYAVLYGNYNYEDKLGYMFLAEDSTEYNKNNNIKKVFLYDEDEKIQEGRISTKNMVLRDRSTRLRKAALSYFTIENKLFCFICGFDFADFYGDLGRGYIEFHHKKPIYQYEDEDTDKIIVQALQNLIPVCSNCHSMLHRIKGINADILIEILAKKTK